MGIAQVEKTRNTEEHSESVGNAYSSLIHLVENAHYRLLDVIKDELHRSGRTNMTAVQALLLYNIGDETFSATDLKRRGCYMGSNVSYNLKKMADGGFVNCQRSKADGRAIQIRLTEAGLEIHNIVRKLFERHAGLIEAVGDINVDDILKLNQISRRLEHFWIDWILYRR